MTVFIVFACILIVAWGLLFFKSRNDNQEMGIQLIM